MGGVKFLPCIRIMLSANVSTDGLNGAKAPVITRCSGGAVPSTITIDLLPVVIAASLRGRSSNEESR